MSDNWGPVLVAVVLYVLLAPGLLFQVPGNNRFIEFGSFQTSGLSILVHSILYFCLICIFLLAMAPYKASFLLQTAKMADWGPVLVGVVLFILLQPGLLFQLPGNNKHVDFGGLKTNGKSIARTNHLLCDFSNVEVSSMSGSSYVETLESKIAASLKEIAPGTSLKHIVLTFNRKQAEWS
ncbi:hypothetical protein Leryth_000406 [Lithospermum erythrorhizon]|nr:hypothetical protein Leryth_000406 [Lithospermum erythrorhizon]